MTNQDEPPANASELLGALTRSLAEVSAERDQLSVALGGVTSAPGYQVLEAVRGMIAAVAPPGTLRGVFVAAGARGLACLLNQGLRGFLLRSVTMWRWLPRIVREARRARGRGQTPDSTPPGPQSDLEKSGQEGGVAVVPAPSVLEPGTASPSPRDAINGRYSEWLASAFPAASEAQSRGPDEETSFAPRFSFIVPVEDEGEAVVRLLRSIAGQTFSGWEVWLAGTAGADALRVLGNAAGIPEDKARVLSVVGGQNTSELWQNARAVPAADFVVSTLARAELHPRALEEVVHLLATKPAARVVYSDEDRVTPTGQHVQPFFKPDWSPDLLLATNFLSAFLVVSRDVAEQASMLPAGAGAEWRYDIALRLAELTDEIEHIPLPLVSLPLDSDERADIAKEEIASLMAALVRRQIGGQVEETPVPRWYQVHRDLAESSLVSVIIPTRDRAGLLSKCLDSIARSSYPNVEVIVVDNGSTEAETQRLLLARQVKVVRHDEPFNFSRLINAGSRAAAGEYLLLLNNDTEAITPGWIEEMLAQASQPEVGAVGARLLYPDGSPQHEGMGFLTLRGMPLRSRHFTWSREDGFAYAIREMSAVTGACLMTRRTVFEEAGGFDEGFGVSYGDVDYCLRLRRQGLKVIYTPYAELYHVEGASRGAYAPAIDDRLAVARWGSWVDPYYSSAIDEVLAPFRTRTEYDPPLPSLLQETAPCQDESTGLGVNLSGFFTSEKGIGEAGRAHLRSLEAAGIPFVLNPLFEGGAENMQRASAALTDAAPYRVNLICANADVLPAMSAERPASYFQDHYNICVWGWEFMEFPPEWLPYFEAFQEIWAPSAFIAESLSRVARAGASYSLFDDE